MTLPLIRQKAYLAAKTEVTRGTAIALTAADAGYLVFDKTFKVNSSANPVERPGALGSRLLIPGSRSVDLSFKSYVYGSGTSGTPIPKWANVFLPACGFGVTGSTFALTSDQTQWTTFTAGHYIDGLVTMGRGFMGELSMDFQTGKLAELSWKFSGGYSTDRSAATLLTGVTYDTGKPLVYGGVANALSVNGASLYVSKVGIAISGGVHLCEDPASPGGYLAAFLGQREITITLDPETTVACGFWGNYTNGDVLPISVLLGSVAGNIVTISTANAQLAQVPEDGERNGKVIDTLTFKVNLDDLSIAFS